MIDIIAIRAVHAEAVKMQKAVLRSTHVIDEIDTNENDVNAQISAATSGLRFRSGDHRNHRDAFEAERVICPKYSINGTATVVLAEDARRAADALRASVAAVRDLAPNGRDYVLGGFKDAQDEWQALNDRLVSVLDEVKAYQLAISDRGR